MKTDLLRILLSMIIFTILLTACGGNAPVPSAATATVVPTQEPVSTTVASAAPDPCLSPQIEAEAQKVQRHMREFDDASTLASNVPQAQLSTSIADLQRIRREADDEPIPPCLTDLKAYQINHMNSVINTLLAFMRSNDPRSIDCVDIASNTEEEAVCQNIALAREQHDQYLIELARILGLTVIAATPAPASTPAETPTPQ
jgi:hypothetical protein